MTEEKIKKKDADIIDQFASSIIKGTKPLDKDISKWVDDNFWSLT